MIDISTAYEIAISEVRIPDDAVLAYAGYLSNRYVFEWKHTTDTTTSDMDRVLVWIDPTTGNVMKSEVTWSRSLEPPTDIMSIQSTSGMPITEYCKIGKDAFFTYSGTPLDDYYWISHYNDTIYLIDNTGTIVGEMIPKPDNFGTLFSGLKDFDHPYCWYLDFYRTYFNRWADSYDDVCSPNNNEYFSNLHASTFYHCTAHSNKVESVSFKISDLLTVHEYDVTTILQDRSPIPFAELCHCQAMNDTGLGTLSYAYRKGQNVGTITIGCKHTTSASWRAYLQRFRGTLYRGINDNRDTSIKQIYDDAMADTYGMDGHYEFAGDTNLTLNNIIEGICELPICGFSATTF